MFDYGWGMDMKDMLLAISIIGVMMIISVIGLVIR